MNCVEVWWNTSSQAQDLRLDNQWSAGLCPTVFHQPGASARSSAEGSTNAPQAEGGTNAPHKPGKGIKDTEQQELNRRGRLRWSNYGTRQIVHAQVGQTRGKGRRASWVEDCNRVDSQGGCINVNI